MVTVAVAATAVTAAAAADLGNDGGGGRDHAETGLPARRAREANAASVGQRRWWRVRGDARTLRLDLGLLARRQRQEEVGPAGLDVRGQGEGPGPAARCTWP